MGFTPVQFGPEVLYLLLQLGFSNGKLKKKKAVTYWMCSNCSIRISPTVNCRWRSSSSRTGQSKEGRLNHSDLLWITKGRRRWKFQWDSNIGGVAALRPQNQKRKRHSSYWCSNLLYFYTDLRRLKSTSLRKNGGWAGCCCWEAVKEMFTGGVFWCELKQKRVWWAKKDKMTSKSQESDIWVCS